MNYNLEIQKLLLDINCSGLDDQIILLKEAIKIADSNNDLDWGYELRTNLIDKYAETSRSPKEYFIYFAWLLNTEDVNPILFDSKYTLTLYPWMLSSMCNTVDISKEQIESVLEDYKIRLEKNGYNLKGYFESLVYWEIFKGDQTAASMYYEEYVKFSATNTRLSEYALFLKMRIELMSDNLDKALWYAKDIINPLTHHSSIKLFTYSLLTFYLAKNEDSRALEMFNEAEKEFKIVTDSKSSASIMAIADMLFYMARYDKEKAWNYFLEYVPYTVSLEDDTNLSFCEKILPLFEEGGSRALDIPNQLPYYSPKGIYNLKDIYDYYLNTSKRLSKQFDERNGTNTFTKELNEIIT